MSGKGDVKNMYEFLEKFNTEKACLQYLAKMRWGDGVICPYCSKTRIYYFADGVRYKCAECLKKFNVKTGTIFYNSKIPLRKWFLAIHLLTSHKKGISSMQLAKDINVQQKTAWGMLHRIRGLFTDADIASGLVEVDETYIGGKEKNKHIKLRQKGTQGRSLQTKEPVFGILERKGKVHAIHVPDLKADTLKTIMFAKIRLGSKIFTDEYKAYRNIKEYEHKRCCHSRKHYVNGEAHTNGLENFWSLVKRAILGIYHWVSAKYLQLYLNEFCFRYNTRDMSGMERVDFTLRRI